MRWACLLGLILLSSCQGEKPTVDLGFYHWKTSFDLPQEERLYMDSLGASRLYLRFFDLDWDAQRQEVIPLAMLEQKARPPKDWQVVPTIFITNRCMLQMADEQLPALADRMHRKITDLWRKLELTQPLQEWQLDCDWTEQSRARYFELLELLGAKFGPTVTRSATIRLHQVKYFQKTGVPPVDRGMLMCYNVGELGQWETENSILDPDILKAYLVNFDRYPLTLDLVLPLFRWGILFRDERMIRLINGLHTAQLQDTSRFEVLGPHRHLVRQGTFLEGHYLYKGDQIRLEKTDLALLQQVSQILQPHWPSNDYLLCFYHLDRELLPAFPADSLLQVKDHLQSKIPE